MIQTHGRNRQPAWGDCGGTARHACLILGKRENTLFLWPLPYHQITSKWDRQHEDRALSNFMQEIHSETGRAYTIIDEIGRGGYASTYLAKRSDDHEKVVIKLLHLDFSPSFPDLQARIKDSNQRLRTEYRCLIRLARVTCVAHTLDFGTLRSEAKGLDIDLPFIVQEFVEGVDLDKHLASRSLKRFTTARRGRFGGVKNVRKFFELASQIASAVAQIHRNEVVHGDLWPQNIRVRPSGDAVIVDLGQWLLLDLELLAKGQPVSYPYAAPERRDPLARWSTAADIYSLGGTLFFMATGEDPPQPIDDWDELKHTVAHKIERCNPELFSAKSGIARVIARCLRFSDRDRPPFAESVLEELDIYPSIRRAPRLSEAMGSFRRAVSQIERDKNDVFRHIAAVRIRTLARQFEDMSRGLLSADKFNALPPAPEANLETLTGEFDALLSQMQTSKARAGVRRAFHASPKQLGRAAVAAARKRG
jgi:serine/threonine protein kinase